MVPITNKPDTFSHCLIKFKVIAERFNKFIKYCQRDCFGLMTISDEINVIKQDEHPQLCIFSIFLVLICLFLYQFKVYNDFSILISLLQSEALVQINVFQ